jgi:hypothetical protein
MRRRLAVVALTPLVGAWLLYVGGSATPVSPTAPWYAGVGVASLLGAAVLAGYVPVAGRRLDLGCTPCAALSAASVVGATMAMRNYGADVSGPLVASAVLLFGLSQRLTQPATCPAPVRDPR